MGWDKNGLLIGGEWRTNDPSFSFGATHTLRLSEDNGLGFVARGGVAPAGTSYGDLLSAAEAFCKSTTYKAAYYAKGLLLQCYYVRPLLLLLRLIAAPTTITRTASTTTSTPLTGTNCVSFTLAMERVILSPGSGGFGPLLKNSAKPPVAPVRECGGEPFRLGPFTSLLVFHLSILFCSILFSSVLFRPRLHLKL
jgi:hypothetical protein